jgi:hypothetical protein
MSEMMTAMMTAILFYHVIHSIMELKGVKYKIAKLEATISSKPFKEKSFKMDSIPKMMMMMMVMMLIFLAVPMFAMKTAGLDIMTMVKISVVLILVIEIINYIGYNDFHKKVGELNSRIKK